MKLALGQVSVRVLARVRVMFTAVSTMYYRFKVSVWGLYSYPFYSTPLWTSKMTELSPG